MKQILLFLKRLNVRVKRFRAFEHVALVFLVFVMEGVCHPCSTIARRGFDGDFSLGANYDWKARGGFVFLSPQGQYKAFSRIGNHDFHKSVSWVSRFASLTLSQFGRDYPMQGINEVGLAGAVLVAPADYPNDGSHGLLSENLWLQYQLDNFENINQVVDHVNDFGIQKISADLHWFLCDSTGECVTIEFENSRAKVYRASDQHVQVLTNSSVTHSWHFFNQWKQSGAVLPVGYGSFARFSRLAFRASQQGPVDMINALEDVSLDGFTAWQTIFNLSKRSLQVRLPNQSWIEVSFFGRELACNFGLEMLSLNEPIWQPYNKMAVREILRQATDGLPDLEVKSIERAFRRSNRIVCM